MIYFGIFLAELILLFIFSTFLISDFVNKVHTITKSKTFTIHLLFYLFLPGIIIHELSHVIFSALLFVPIGELNLFPQITKEGIHLGSVEIAKTGFIRRFIIGISPMIIGLILIFGIIYSLIGNSYFLTELIPIWVINVLLIYLLITVSNTMFSSKKDLEGAWKFFLILIIVIGVLYFAGVRIDFTRYQFLAEYLKRGAIYLAIPLGINILIFAFFKLISKVKSH